MPGLWPRQAVPEDLDAPIRLQGHDAAFTRVVSPRTDSVLARCGARSHAIAHVEAHPSSRNVPGTIQPVHPSSRSSKARR